MGPRNAPKVVDLVEIAQLTGEIVTVAPHAPVREHIRAGLDARLRNLVTHDPGTRQGTDPEELHQMRVSVRRIRAMLKAGRPWLDRAWSEPLLEKLSWLGRCLGPVRDLDVLLAGIRHSAAGFDNLERASVERLITGLDQQRDEARSVLLAELDSGRYRDLLSTLGASVQHPLPASESEVDDHTAFGDLLQAQFHTLRTAVERDGRAATDERLHELRLRGKRLRYSAELAAPMDGPSVRRLVSCAKKFQDVLGEHHDACVAEERIRALLAEHRDDTDAAFVAGRLVEREQARKAAYRAEWWNQWEDLREAAEEIETERARRAHSGAG